MGNVLFFNPYAAEANLGPGQKVLEKITRIANEICFYFLKKGEEKKEIEMTSGQSKAECFKILLKEKQSLTKEMVTECCEKIQHTGNIPLLPEMLSQKEEAELGKYIKKSQKFLN